MKKLLLQFVLTLGIFFFAYLVYASINAPIEFEKVLKTRTADVVQRLKDIRTIEKAFKMKYGHYTADFDSLIAFYNSDSISYELATGSEDDTLAVQQGRVSSIIVKIAAKDSLFKGTNFNINEISIIPYSNGEKFSLGATDILTESEVMVNVFEASARYFQIFPEEKYRQDIINLNDKRETAGRYKGLKVGSLEKANNDAGNWEN